MSKMTKRWLSIVTTLAVAFVMCFGCMGEVFAVEGQVEGDQPAAEKQVEPEGEATVEQQAEMEAAVEGMPEGNLSISSVDSVDKLDDSQPVDITVKYGDIEKQFIIVADKGIYYKDGEEYKLVPNAKNGETISYSTVNNAATGETKNGMGPKLSTLLNVAGVDTSELNGKTLKFYSNYGYEDVLSWNQLVNTARYSFDEVVTNGKAISEEIVKTQVPTIINVSSSNCGVLMFGQVEASERNNPFFLSGLMYKNDRGAKIEVIDSDYGQNADSIALATNQGTVVTKGSEINFNTKSWGKKQMVYFTTDGSEPTQKSAIYNFADKNKGLTEDEKYQGPIAKAYGPMVVKVKAYGFTGYPSNTQTFNFVVRDAELDASKATVNDVVYNGRALTPNFAVENLAV